MSEVRHSVKTRQMAIELRNAGWKYNEIVSILAERGVDPAPSQSTIAVWTNPKNAERQRLTQLRINRAKRVSSATFRLSGPSRSPEWRLGRMERLAEAGLSHNAIAKVMTFDFPDTPLTHNQVRASLTRGNVPRSFKRLAA